MDTDDDWNDAIQEWLEKHDDDDVGMPEGRHVIPESAEEILTTDISEAIERKKDYEFSLRWGWMWDLSAALWDWLLSWFTTDVVLGLFRASYAMIITGLLIGIIYSVYYAKEHPVPRTLPTIEELMKPAEPEGSTHPQEGSR